MAFAYNLKLLDEWRVRVADANNQPFSLPTRLYFRDASTTDDKGVYADISGETSLGNTVELDAAGYVPITGVWLEAGAYSVAVQIEDYDPTTGLSEWIEQWEIPYILGADDGSSSSVSEIINTVTDLRATTSPTTNDNIVVQVAGYYTLNDNGGGLFYWNPTSFGVDDGGYIIKPTDKEASSPGRWFAIFDQEFQAKRFGVHSTVNGNSFFVKLNAYLTGYPSFGHTVIWGAYDYLVSTNITMNAGKHRILDKANFNIVSGSYVVTFSNTVVESMYELGGFLFLDNKYVKPEWFGAKHDGSSDDADYLQNTYSYAEIYGKDVFLTNSYIIDSAVDFNTNGIVNTRLGHMATVTNSTNGGNCNFGELSEDTIKSTALFYGTLPSIKVVGPVKSHWIDSISVTKMNLTDFDEIIWTEDFSFTAAYSTQSTTHSFDGGKFHSVYALNLTKNKIMDASNFDSFNSALKVSSELTLTNINNTTLSATAGYHDGIGVLNLVGVVINLESIYGITIDAFSFTANGAIITSTIGGTVPFDIISYNTLLMGVITSNVLPSFTTNSSGVIKNAVATNCQFSNGINLKATVADSYVNNCVIRENVLTSGNITDSLDGDGTWNNDEILLDTSTPWQPIYPTKLHHIVIENNIHLSSTTTIKTTKATYSAASLDIIDDTSISFVSLKSTSYTLNDINSLFLLTGNEDTSVTVSFHNALTRVVNDTLGGIVEVKPTILCIGDNGTLTTLAEQYKPYTSYADLTEDMNVWRIADDSPNDRIDITFNCTIEIYNIK